MYMYTDVRKMVVSPGSCYSPQCIGLPTLPACQACTFSSTSKHELLDLLHMPMSANVCV